jgi:undecaprenyl-diphosphatase
MMTAESASIAPEIVEAPLASAVRSPSDLLRAIVGATVFVIVLSLEVLFGDTLVGFASDLLRGLDAVPAWLATAIVVGARILAVVFLVGGFVTVVLRGRVRLLLTTAIGAALAIGLFFVLDVFAPDAGEAVSPLKDTVGIFSDRGFPTAVGLAAVIGIVGASAPWLSRRWRRLGWVLAWGVILTRLFIAPIGFETFSSVIAGWLGGALALVALGAPPRRPSGAAIAAGLARVGVPLAKLEQASLDARGSTVYFATSTGGHKLFVKALGDDERSADLLFRIYRRLQPRDYGDEKAFSSLRRAVEHEALVSRTAAALGVRTPAVVAFATAEPNGFVLAYDAIDGKSLDRVPPEAVTDDVLDEIWGQLALLRTRRIAHRDLRLANVFLGSERDAWIIDFGFSELAASDLLLATDLAELLASSALQVGVQRAVQRGLAATHPAELATSVPRLHPATLSGATRTAYKQQPGLLDELRATVEAASKGA